MLLICANHIRYLQTHYAWVIWTRLTDLLYTSCSKCFIIIPRKAGGSYNKNDAKFTFPSSAPPQKLSRKKKLLRMYKLGEAKSTCWCFKTTNTCLCFQTKNTCLFLKWRTCVCYQTKNTGLCFKTKNTCLSFKKKNTCLCLRTKNMF